MPAPEKIAVQMWISEMAYSYHVVFTLPRGQHAIGRSYAFNSLEDVFAILRRAHANLETINIVEHALRERRPCSVQLTLTAEQFSRLSRKPATPDRAPSTPPLRNAR
jgi:hypothetical protein